MSFDVRMLVQPDLGGWAKECENCYGEGYVQVASTTEPDENDYELCGECEGSGVIDTREDSDPTYYEDNAVEA